MMQLAVSVEMVFVVREKMSLIVHQIVLFSLQKRKYHC